MTEPVLRITDLHVRRDNTPVLHGVSLDVHAGEIVAVLGANGAGKSTLLAATAGLLKPYSGTVTSSRRVATVLQSPSLARRSAQRNVELALAWSGAPRAQRRRRAGQALNAMNAADFANRPARSLSGGQQRRIHLARAVAVAPDVMLLDEPFDGLDPATHVRLRDDAARALRDAGGAVLVVLHDRRDAWAMADRIAVLVDGRLDAVGRPQELLDAPPTAAVARFLGYDGELHTETGVLLTRAARVRVDAGGDLAGRVEVVTPVEDGALLTVATERGRLRASSDRADLAIGDDVRVRIEHGVQFAGPASGAGTYYGE